MPLRPFPAPLQYQQWTAPCRYHPRGSLFLLSIVCLPEDNENNSVELGLFDSDEGGHEASRRAVMGFRPNDAANQRRHLIDAVWPMIREIGAIIVFPTRRGSVGAPNSG